VPDRLPVFRKAQALEIDVHFAHPYASWERGTNENTSGLIRQYFLKGTDFATVTEAQIEAVIWLLNTRPRICLYFRTPEMGFSE
jgi:IS30 family transposase